MPDKGRYPTEKWWTRPQSCPPKTLIKDVIRGDEVVETGWERTVRLRVGQSGKRTETVAHFYGSSALCVVGMAQKLDL